MADFKAGLLGDQPKAFDQITDCILSGQRIIKLVGFAGCFIGFTNVRTRQGLKAIQEIEIGDEVLSFSDQLEWKRVLKTFRYSVVQVKHNLLILSLFNGQRIRCTSDHEFLTEEGYVSAIELAWRAVEEGAVCFSSLGKQSREDLKLELEAVRSGKSDEASARRKGISSNDDTDRKAIQNGENTSTSRSGMDTKSQEQGNSQSQERGQHGQSDRKPGMGYSGREHEACLSDRLSEQSRGEQSVFQANREASTANSNKVSSTSLHAPNVGTRIRSKSHVHKNDSRETELEACYLNTSEIEWVNIIPCLDNAEWVYDLHVEDNYNYCITDKNYIVHNSGKTFLLSKIAQWSQSKGYDVTLAAPTHKAAGVIREKLGDLGLEIKTIHSLLGFGMPRDIKGDTGKRQLVKQRDNEIHGLVIVDEGSMIGEVLLQEIKTKTRVQWLFVGDSAQLSPVGEKPSVLLQNPDATLDITIRQKEGSEILKLATKIRHGDLSFCFDEGKDVEAVDAKSDLFERAHDRFMSAAYQKDASHARMLVFRNAVRRDINDRMRELVIGTPEPFSSGEWLVMYSPFQGPTKYDRGAQRFLSIEEIFGRQARLNTLAEEAKIYKRNTGSGSKWRRFFEYKESFSEKHFHTSQEVLVVDAQSTVADVDSDWFKPFKMWNLTVKTDGFVYRNLPVLDRSEYESFKNALSQQRQEALKFSEMKEEVEAGSAAWREYEDQRVQAWKRYFLLDELFAHVDYAYCLTTHKAQGSTFEHVLIDMPDLMASSMKQRLIYVAFTRASKSVTFIR